MWNFDWLLPVDTETSGPDEWLNADAVFQFDSTEDDSARLLNSYPSSASLEHSITTPSSSSLSSVSPSTTLTSPPTTTNNTSNDELEHLLSDTSFQAFQTALAAAAAAKNSKKASTFGYLDALQSPTPIKGSTAGSVSGEPDDKRKRNTAASARFRAKKKMREMALEQAAKESMAKSEMLERRLCEYEMEIKWLRQLVTEQFPSKKLRDIYSEHNFTYIEDSPAAGSGVEQSIVGAFTPILPAPLPAASSSSSSVLLKK